MLPAIFTPALLKNLELFKIRSRRAFLGSRQGGHVSLKRGHGLEFSDYRRYELGDNPRHIDWGVYARSDKLIVKTFQEEQDLSVLILIDPSNSMRPASHPLKWERAIATALALAYIALMQQDRVSISIPGIKDTPFLTGMRAIHSLAKTLAELSPVQPADLTLSMRSAISRVRFPGLAIFISDFLMPLEQVREITELLRAKNLDITAIQILGESDVTPFGQVSDAVAEDSETGEQLEFSWNSDTQTQYAFMLSQHSQQVRSLLLSRGIGFSSQVTSQLFDEFMLRSLPATGLLK